MSFNKYLDGQRNLGVNTQSGMIKSVLSPFPAEFPVPFTDFLDLNRIPKTTITETLFNITQTLNILPSGTNSESATPLYNFGTNTSNQLYIKTEAEGDELTDPNPPAILIDTNGDVYINGTQISSSQSTGFLYEFDTQGITQYNRR